MSYLEDGMHICVCMCPTFKVVCICVCASYMVVVCVCAYTYTYKPLLRYHNIDTLMVKDIGSLHMLHMLFALNIECKVSASKTWTDTIG